MKKKAGKVNTSLKKYISAAVISVIIFTGLILTGFLIFDNIIMPDYSRTGQEFPVPDITGYNIERAREILEAEGFVMSDEITEKTDYDNPAGKILVQYPKAGANCKLGRNIFVTVSTGALPVAVPKLIGLSPQDAEYRIAESRLFLDSVLYEFSTQFPEGVVMGQSLVVNDSAAIGDSIYIVVSVGRHPTEFIIPEVKGKLLDIAAEELSKGGFKISEIVYMKNEDYLPYTVLDQRPDPGEIVFQGAEVKLLVSTLTEPADTDSTEAKEKAEKFHE